MGNKKNVKYTMTLVENINEKLDKLDKKTKKYDRTLAKTDKNLSRLKTGLVRTFGAAIVVRGLIKSINLMAEFEREVSNLSSITGATGTDLVFLKIKAMEMGLETTKSAKQVVQAFKLVGSERPELLKDGKALSFVTKNALTLAEAAGLDVPEAAKALTTGLAQFNAPAKDSARFMNVLAAGSKYGAANIPFLAQALEKAGAVASDANLSFERTTAAIEVLAPKIKEPATAGLNLRNVLLRLQKANLGMKSGTFDLIDALEEAKEKYTDITKQTKLFGIINITAGKALMNNIPQLKEYEKAVTGTNTAIEQASINTDNLKGDIDKIKGKYQGFVLGLNSGRGAIGQTSRGFVQLGSSILDALTVTEKMSYAMADEYVKMNSLVSKITDVDTEQKERTQGILELQKLYPKYFSNLDAETTNNDELRKALRGVNKELAQQILLQQAKEKLDKSKGKVGKARAVVQSADTKLFEILGKYNLKREQEGLDPFELPKGTTEEQLKAISKEAGAGSTRARVNEALELLRESKGMLGLRQRQFGKAGEEAKYVLQAYNARRGSEGGNTNVDVNVAVDASGKNNKEVARQVGSDVQNEIEKELNDIKNN